MTAHDGSTDGGSVSTLGKYTLGKEDATMTWGLICLFIGIGGFGVGLTECAVASSIDGEAEDANSEAEQVIRETNNRIKGKKRSLKAAITIVEEAKNRLLQGSMTEYCTQMSRIKEVVFNPSEGLFELQEFNITQAKQRRLNGKDDNPFTTGVGSMAGGALASSVCYQAAATFGTASTGTAISALHGVAAKNAALACLGGGAKAMGGLGISGGLAALGGVAVGAGAVVFGGVKLFEAGSRREIARANLAEARAYEAEVDTVLICIDCTVRKLQKFAEIVDAIADRLKWQTAHVERIIEREGASSLNFTQDEWDQLDMAFETAKTAKDLLDLQIVIHEDGSFDGKSDSALRKFAAMAGVSENLF